MANFAIGRNGGVSPLFRRSARAGSSTAGGSASTSCGLTGCSSANSQGLALSDLSNCSSGGASSLARASSIAPRKRCGSVQASATSIWLRGDHASISRSCRSRACLLVQGWIVRTCGLNSSGIGQSASRNTFSAVLIVPSERTWIGKLRSSESGNCANRNASRSKDVSWTLAITLTSRSSNAVMPDVSSAVIPICCLSLGVSSSAISAGTRNAFGLEFRIASTTLSNPFGTPSSTCSTALLYPALLSPTHRRRRAARSSLSVGRNLSSNLRLASFVP